MKTSHADHVALIFQIPDIMKHSNLHLCIIFTLILLSFEQAACHGRLTMPTTRDELTNTPDYISNAPTSFDSMFVCRNLPPMDPTLTLIAGSTFQVEWFMSAPHVGDCFLYLSYDTYANPVQMKWFKIAQFAECKNINDQLQQVTLPAYLPKCDHCVLRWEWYALHRWPAVEFYSQCVDVVILGLSNGILPSPMVTVPGHLPLSDTLGAYRNPYDPAAPFFFTGPPVATLGGNPTFGPVVPKPSPNNNAPTPVLTPAPTVSTNLLDCSKQTDGVYCEQGNCCPTFSLCALGIAYRNQIVPPGTVCSNGIFVDVNSGICRNQACTPLAIPTPSPTPRTMTPVPTPRPLPPAPAPTPRPPLPSPPAPSPSMTCAPNSQSVKCYPGNCCPNFYVCDAGRASSLFSTGSNGVLCSNGGFVSRGCEGRTCPA